LDVVVVIVERAQGAQIGVSRWTYFNEICPSPGESRSSVFLNSNISEHSGMSSVPIWECVNLSDKPMMKANGDFIKSESLVSNPEPSISQKRSDTLVDLMKGTAYAHVSGPIPASPFPRLGKHSSVKFTQINFVQRIPALHNPGTESPFLRLKNVLSFPLVQLFLGCEAWNQFRSIIGMYRSVAGN